MDQLTLAGVIVLLAVIAADRFWPREAAPVPAPVAAMAPDDAPAAVPLPATTSVAREPGLIAVLPFRNRSVREEDAYLRIPKRPMGLGDCRSIYSGLSAMDAGPSPVRST